MRTTATQTSRGSACDVETSGHGRHDVQHERREVRHVVFKLLVLALKLEVPLSGLLGAPRPPFSVLEPGLFRERKKYDVVDARKLEIRHPGRADVIFHALRGRAEVGDPTSGTCS